MARFIIFVGFGLWLGLSLLAADIADPAGLYIEAYSGQSSVLPGEDAVLHVATSAKLYSVVVERVGAARREVWRADGLKGAHFGVPDDASANGCQWPGSLRIPVGLDWVSGYYEVSLKAVDGGGQWTRRGQRTASSTAFFIVRSAQPKAKILLQLATNTYNAYTNYGGFSLYAYHANSKNQGHRVSFDRPQSSQFAKWELPFVAWCERSGIALDYAANIDLELHPGILAPYRLMLSVGHDEYWSGPMRDTVEGFIAKGGNAAFFSGNTCCWQVRSEESGRALTCWKQNFGVDPVWKEADRRSLSTLWSHRAIKRPENQMTGVGFLWGGYCKSHGQFMDSNAEYTVHRPAHWALAGSGLQQGSVFGAKDTIVGYECDGCELVWRDGLPFPTFKDGTPKSFEVVATCPVSWHPDDAVFYDGWDLGRVGQAVLGSYIQGGTVFTVGSTDWAHGLASDPAVQKITQNVLTRLGQ
jgi:hypothetical protein